MTKSKSPKINASQNNFQYPRWERKGENLNTSGFKLHDLRGDESQPAENFGIARDHLQWRSRPAANRYYKRYDENKNIAFQYAEINSARASASKQADSLPNGSNPENVISDAKFEESQNLGESSEGLQLNYCSAILYVTAIRRQFEMEILSRLSKITRTIKPIKNRCPRGNEEHTMKIHIYAQHVGAIDKNIPKQRPRRYHFSGD